MIDFYHIINPYIASRGSESEAVQRQTFSSLHLAKDFAKDVVNVRHVLRVDKQDEAEFHKVPPIPGCVVEPLERCSSDIASFQISRRLPLLADLFNSSFLSTEAEKERPFGEDHKAYVIYTNMDICLAPFFYTECARLIAANHECFVVNRRTVAKEYLNRPLLEGFLASSKPHPGHDCFVFPLASLREFALTDSIVGIGFVFRPLLLNCILTFGGRFREFNELFLTAHYGDDMEWKDPRYSDYLEHNKRQLIGLWDQFRNRIENADAATKKLLEKFFRFGFLQRVI